MKRIHVGAKVKIKDSNGSGLKVGSIHTIAEKYRWKECRQTVWRIDIWLFRRSHLELI